MSIQLTLISLKTSLNRIPYNIESSLVHYIHMMILQNSYSKNINFQFINNRYLYHITKVFYSKFGTSVYLMEIK